MNSSRRIMLSWLVSLTVAGGLTGCASMRSGSPSSAVTATMDQNQQQAMTPNQALARLTEGNARFASGASLHRDYIAQKKATAAAQHPFAIVLACIDSRTAPEIIFDQGIGDIFSPRIAGNYSTTDILGSMEFAAKVAGARVIVVVGHTECGAVMGACDNVELGNLTTVMQAIRPAVDQVTNVSGDRNSGNPKFVLAATEMNVRHAVTMIRRDSAILRELETAGQLKIVGAMHDIATGKVTYLN